MNAVDYISAKNAFDEKVLRELHTRVLGPVANSALSEEELEEYSVRVERVPGKNTWSVVASVWARGEFWSRIIWEEGCEPSSFQEVGELIADSLCDWISESRFAWGQQRRVSFIVRD